MVLGEHKLQCIRNCQLCGWSKSAITQMHIFRLHKKFVCGRIMA